MLKVWGRTNSINVQKVLWTLEELGLAFDRIDAGMQFGVNDTEAFRLMNPNQLVPVLQDGEFVLWESHAIMRYVAALDNTRALWPEDRQAAAIIDQWLDWTTSTVWPDMKPVFRNMVRMPREQWDLVAIAAGVAGLNSDMAILDQRLQATPFVAGDSFSLADIPLALIVHRWLLLDIDREDVPAVRQWYDRLAQRPAFKQHCDLPLS